MHTDFLELTMERKKILTECFHNLLNAEDGSLNRLGIYISSIKANFGGRIESYYWANHEMNQHFGTNAPCTDWAGDITYLFTSFELMCAEIFQANSGYTLAESLGFVEREFSKPPADLLVGLNTNMKFLENQGSLLFSFDHDSDCWFKAFSLAFKEIINDGVVVCYFEKSRILSYLDAMDVIIVQNLNNPERNKERSLT